MIRFTVGTYSVDVDSYQWGYKEGTVYVERDLGTTPSGTLFRHKTGTSGRVLTVRFALSDTLISQLRQLGIEAMRRANRVQFFPDTADLGTYRWIDWPESMTLKHSEEGRLTFEVPLPEQV